MVGGAKTSGSARGRSLSAVPRKPRPLALAYDPAAEAAAVAAVVGEAVAAVAGEAVAGLILSSNFRIGRD